MGGYMKKGQGTTHNNSSSRGRSYKYGVVLIIAFGAAILGVMALHKLRERRIFNLLVKEKDRQLFSLQLLLHKERDYAKETKRVTEEMKSKLYTLRAQKIDLDSRILEMQSTISSLKDEQKAMETALEEKQNEVKFLRDKEVDLNKESPQLTSLSETLRQKEAEIVDLKNRFGSRVNVWSVSADDPSNHPVHLTLARSNENEVTDSEGKSGNNSMRKGDREEESRKLEVPAEGSRNGSEKSGDEGKGKGVEDSRDGVGLRIGNEERKEIGTEGILKSGVEVQNRRDKGSNVKAIDSKELGVNYKGGVKLEMPDHSENGASYKLRGNRTNARKGKGKRWRVIAKKGDSEENRVVRVRGRRFFKDTLESERTKRIEDGEVQKMIKHEDRDVGLNARNESKEDGKLSVSDDLQLTGHLESKADARNAEEKMVPTMVSMRNGEKGEESATEPKNVVVSTGVALLKGEKSEDSETTREKVEKGKEMETVSVPYEKPRDFPGELPLNRTVDGEGSGVDGEGKQKPGEVGIKQEIVDNDSKQGRIADEDEETEDLEVEDIQESGNDISRESKSSKFEENEEDRDEIEEPEF